MSSRRNETLLTDFSRFPSISILTFARGVVCVGGARPRLHEIALGLAGDAAMRGKGRNRFISGNSAVAEEDHWPVGRNVTQGIIDQSGS